MERQLKISFGLSEIFAMGSIYLYQSAFAFSMVLLGFAIISKFIAYSIELSEKKAAADQGKEAISNIAESFISLLQTKSYTNSGGNGYH